MKIQAVILSAALVLSAAGCEQKADQAAKSSAPENVITQKIQEPAEQIKQAKKANREPEQTSEKRPIVTESSDKIAPPQTTEQSLTEISTYGREVTKTQVSKSRNRAQEAEDDMLRDLAQRK